MTSTKTGEVVGIYTGIASVDEFTDNQQALCVRITEEITSWVHFLLDWNGIEKTNANLETSFLIFSDGSLTFGGNWSKLKSYKL